MKGSALIFSCLLVLAAAELKWDETGAYRLINTDGKTPCDETHPLEAGQEILPGSDKIPIDTYVEAKEPMTEEKEEIETKNEEKEVDEEKKYIEADDISLTQKGLKWDESGKYRLVETESKPLALSQDSNILHPYYKYPFINYFPESEYYRALYSGVETTPIKEHDKTESKTATVEKIYSMLESNDATLHGFKWDESGQYRLVEAYPKPLEISYDSSSLLPYNRYPLMNYFPESEYFRALYSGIETAPMKVHDKTESKSTAEESVHTKIESQDATLHGFKWDESGQYRLVEAPNSLAMPYDSYPLFTQSFVPSHECDTKVAPKSTEVLPTVEETKEVDKINKMELDDVSLHGFKWDESGQYRLVNSDHRPIIMPYGYRGIYPYYRNSFVPSLSEIEHYKDMLHYNSLASIPIIEGPKVMEEKASDAIPSITEETKPIVEDKMELDDVSVHGLKWDESGQYRLVDLENKPTVMSIDRKSLPETGLPGSEFYKSLFSGNFDEATMIKSGEREVKISQYETIPMNTEHIPLDKTMIFSHLPTTSMDKEEHSGQHIIRLIPGIDDAVHYIPESEYLKLANHFKFPETGYSTIKAVQ